MSTYSCPECALPTTVIDRLTLGSSTGERIEHVRVSCPAQHHFLCAIDRLIESAPVTKAAGPVAPAA